MAEEIISPPFPADTTTVPRLLHHLTALREWVIDMRFWANETASSQGYPGEVVPPIEQIPAIPDLGRFGAVAVLDIMRSYMGMRGLREQWDAMVRVYEDAWDCKPAVIQRLQCVRHAVIILMNAFVDPETREAREEAMQKKAAKTMHKLLRRMGVPKDMIPGSHFMATPEGVGFGLSQSDPNEIDFDALFHGEESPDEPDDPEGGNN